jgi:MerR family transcriptional regulator, light-induced transcriptional regulator
VDGGSFKSTDADSSFDSSHLQGLSKATTTALFKAIRNAVIPELTQLHSASAAAFLPLRSKLAPPITRRDIRYLQRLVLAENAVSALQFLCKQRSRGVTPESLAIDLIGGTAAALGNCWLDDTLSFATVTTGCNQLIDLLSQIDLLNRFDVQPLLRDRQSGHPVRPNISLCNAFGAQHTLGLRTVDFILRRQGFDSRLLAAANEAQLNLQLSVKHVDVLGFSLCHESQLEPTKKVIEKVREVSLNPHLIVLVGGSLLVQRPELGLSTGADLVSVSAITLGAQLHHILGIEVFASTSLDVKVAL